MDTVVIRLYYDFASTLCYVAHRVLTGIEGPIADLGVELEWRPIDLTMAAPWDRGDSFPDQIRHSVHETAAALGVDIEMPDPWLDSRPASEIALRSTSAADEARWRKAVFATFFDRQTPRITNELAELAIELVGPGTVPQPDDGFPLVETCTREAIALGVTGVPTLLVNDWMCGGVYDEDSMLSVLAQLAARFRESGTSAVN